MSMTQDEVVEAVRYHLNKAADTLEAEIEGFLPHSHRRLKALAAVRQARVLANEAAEIHGVRGSFLAQRAREVNADVEAEEARMASLDPPRYPYGAPVPAPDQPDLWGVRDEIADEPIHDAAEDGSNGCEG